MSVTQNQNENIRSTSFEFSKSEFVTRAIIIVVGIPLTVAILALIWRSTLMYSIKFNEGWNAYFAQAVVQGHPLYLPWDTFRANNYPPLSFLVVAAVTSVIPDAIYAGRFVAWIAFLGIGMLIYAILRSTGNDRTAAGAGAALFYGYMVSQYADYVGMNDPQMLAHLIVCSGFLILLRARQRMPWVVLSAVVMAIGLFVKHNIIALPAATVVWLFFYQRNAFFRFLPTIAGCGVFGLAICELLFGHNFLHDLLLPRTVDIRQGYWKIINWLKPMGAPLCLPVFLQTPALRERYGVMFGIFALFAFILTIVQATGSGVNFNAAFELVIAFSLAGGHLLGRLGCTTPRQRAAIRPYVTATVAASLIFWALARTDQNVVDLPRWIATQRAQAAASRQAVMLISQREGPAVCETLALCYWAGKRFEVSFYNLAEASSIGNLDVAKDKFLRSTAEAKFSSIQLRFRAWPQLKKELRHHYIVLYNPKLGKVGRVYVPKGSG